MRVKLAFGVGFVPDSFLLHELGSPDGQGGAAAQQPEGEDHSEEAEEGYDEIGFVRRGDDLCVYVTQTLGD